MNLEAQKVSVVEKGTGPHKGLTAGVSQLGNELRRRTEIDRPDDPS